MSKQDFINIFEAYRKMLPKDDLSEMMSQPPGDKENLDLKTKDMELLRQGIIAEMDAVNLYEQMAADATDEKVKKVMLDIAYEEKVHAGEFEKVLEEIDPDYERAEAEGEDEVRDMEGEEK
jgi:rubrerythrin